ncbi:hypothetical protein TCAL_16653 [Tigriopus californicus]|uniref:Uncharacterized protein n=1 Tax=Tigriopus californicus TaxID=6832 RepID=A0A553NB14_TIGCA|nr:hypothetical protein TCAL_16653 [Tigriopus californicus]
MVEMMKSDRSERYEAPLPPPTNMTNSSSSVAYHHHHHHHPFNGGTAGLHHPTMSRPMPPPIPSNGGSGHNNQSSPLQRPMPTSIHQQQLQSQPISSNGSIANGGVTVLNGQTPYETDPDHEKWWWVCCLEFCFCLL